MLMLGLLKDNTIIGIESTITMQLHSKVNSNNSDWIIREHKIGPVPFVWHPDGWIYFSEEGFNVGK